LKKEGIDMYTTLDAPKLNLSCLRASGRAPGINRRENLLPSKREIYLLLLIITILAAGILIQTTGYEKALERVPGEILTISLAEPRVAELAPSPPHVQLTSPCPWPSTLVQGGRSRPMAM
jgi:hypothetical protein